MAAPRWLQGAWQRTLLRTAAGDDTTTLVRYVQTRSLFADVRIPATRPHLAGRALADLDGDTLALLAEQQGFAGHVTADGHVCTWHRHLDFQPPAGVPDVGRCEPDGPRALLEHGVYADYLERWERLEDGDGPLVALALEGQPRELLVVAGDHFVHARDRVAALPSGASSLSLAAAGVPRATHLAWLDCALSWGRVRGAGAPWTVLASTVPALEGTAILAADDVAPGSDGRTLSERRRGEPPRTWLVHEGADHVRGLLGR